MHSYYEQESPYPLPFGASLTASLACFMSRRLKRQFTMLIIPFSLAPSPHDASSDQFLSRFTEAIFTKLHCSKGSRQSRCQLCLPR